jgi:hypothetical protein
MFVSLSRACQVAKQAFDEATTEINSTGMDGYNDSTLMMQLLNDNLALWKSELTEGKAIRTFLQESTNLPLAYFHMVGNFSSVDRTATEILHICCPSRVSVM